MVPAISKFFDQVMVNDPDIKLKQNRLNLLNKIANLGKKIADFNMVEV